MTQIDINPITRLEGHGNIKIFTDDAGNVQTAYLQIPELRAFEKFCVGRQAEYMPQLTSRICGVCPVPHHLASNKALDMAYSAPPPARAVALRRLMHYGYIIEDTCSISTSSVAPTCFSGLTCRPGNGTSWVSSRFLARMLPKVS